jgi:hypothetical protein
MVCGRVHFGPIIVNGGHRNQPICRTCGRDVNKAERDQVQRTWNQVSAMLAKYKEKER